MATKKKFFQVDSIEIAINQSGDTAFVPDDSLAYLDTNKALSTIGYAINESLPVLMIGDTGTGKTSAIRYLARETKNGLRRVNLNGSTTVEELVGKILINKDGTYWVDGVLTECMRTGKWLLLDEINAALPEVLFVLHSLLDDDKYIVLSEKEDKEVVRCHKDFRVFATMNPMEEYVGTKELNKAFLSRFPITIHVEYPSDSQEREIIRKRYPDASKLPDDVIENMVGLAHSARDSKNNEDLDFVFSTRDLLQWAQVFMHTQDAKQAARMTFLQKCNKADAAAIQNILSLTFVDQSLKFTEMRKGMAFKLKQHVVVPNAGKVIPAGSILTLLDWQKTDDTNASEAARRVANGVRVRIERVPNLKDLQEYQSANNAAFADPENQKRLASRGSEWTMAVSDLEDKFIPTKL